MRTKTLLELDFAPSTSLYLKFEPPHPSTPAPARDIDVDLLNAATTPPSEYLIPDVLAIATDLPLPPSFDPAQQQPDPPAPAGAGAVAAEDAAEQKKRKEDRLRKLLGGGRGGGSTPRGLPFGTAAGATSEFRECGLSLVRRACL